MAWPCAAARRDSVQLRLRLLELLDLRLRRGEIVAQELGLRAGRLQLHGDALRVGALDGELVGAAVRRSGYYARV